MADISALNKKKVKNNRLGTPPSAVEKVANLSKPSSSEKVPIQVKISPEIRRSFRAYAAERDLELSELFVHMFDYYKQNN